MELQVETGLGGAANRNWAGMGVGFWAGLGLGKGRGFGVVTELWAPHVARVKRELPRDTVSVDEVDQTPLLCTITTRS